MKVYLTNNYRQLKLDFLVPNGELTETRPIWFPENYRSEEEFTGLIVDARDKNVVFVTGSSYFVRRLIADDVNVTWVNVIYGDGGSRKILSDSSLLKVGPVEILERETRIFDPLFHKVMNHVDAVMDEKKAEVDL